jgi:membrane-bound serine protease (ClpP class)
MDFSPAILAGFLATLGLLLIGAELLVPTHGMLAVAGLTAIAGSVITCFLVGPYIGLGAMATVALLGPVVGAGFVELWPRTYLGRRLVLAPPAAARPAPPVTLGMIGVAASEMRPSGVCEFGDIRVEAISEQGLISPGQRVKVIDLVNDRPTVRLIETT